MRNLNWNQKMRNKYFEVRERGHCDGLNAFISEITNDIGYVELVKDCTERQQMVFIEDLMELYMGEAKFTPRRFYIRLTGFESNATYVNQRIDGTLFIDDKLSEPNVKSKFTKKEIETMNPNYIPFAVLAD